MSWSRRTNPANDDPDPSGTDPLADNLRLNRPRRDAGDPAAPGQADNFYEQQTVVDNNFAGRAQTRRSRQIGSPFQTQQITTWVGDPKNSNRLVIIGGALLLFLLLLGAISVYNRLNRPASTADLDDPANAPGLGTDLEAGEPATGATDPGPFESAPPLPEVAPVEEAPPPPTGGMFAVTGTGVEGLFLRPEPSTNTTPITTLPEGTRVEWTGESNSDGIREWRRVRTDAGEGWVAADFLQPAE
jgi:hypothetical protein